MNATAKTVVKASKNRLVVWVTLLLMFALAIFGAVAFHAVYSENRNNAIQQLEDEAHLAAKDVNAFLGRGMTFMELSEIIPVFEKYFSALTNENPQIFNSWYHELRSVMDNIQAASNGEFLATWVCDFDTNVVLQSSNTPWEGDAGWSAQSRPWYNIAMRLKRPFITAPYSDPAGGKSVISFISPIKHKTTGEVIGVFGADLSLDVLASLMKSACPVGRDHLMLIAPDGTIVYHSDSQNLNKKIDNLPYSQEIIESVQSAIPGSYAFNHNGVPVRGHLWVLKDSGWLVLSEVEQSYINRLITNAVSLLGLCFILIFLLLVGSVVLVQKLLSSLKKKETFLEQEVAQRTQSLVKQDVMLCTVNDIAQKLLTSNTAQHFDTVINECLRMLSEATGKNRIYIWKDTRKTNGTLRCTQVQVHPVQGSSTCKTIAYDDIPSLRKKLDKGECLNSFVHELTNSERKMLEAQGIKRLLIAPIIMDTVRWGFIGMDNGNSLEKFTDLEENMLLTSGLMLASAILKQDTEVRIREADEMTQTLLDAMPMACTMWNGAHEPITINEGVVRLFDLDTREAFFERFLELSPKYQSCGSNSYELALQQFTIAFQTGQNAFEWMYQNSKGEPIPSHVTLVRLKFKNESVVASYVRDLRQLKAQEIKQFEVEERTQLMLNAMPLCCNFWNKSFNNLMCNDAAVRLFDLESQQEYLDKFAELSPTKQPNGKRSDEMAVEKITQAFEEGGVRFEWLHQKLDGTPVPCEITLERMIHKGEHIVVGYTRDLRELKAMLAEVRVQQELAEGRDEALAHSRAKSEFLAKMSHEIRTPMNAIVGMSELVLREDITPTTKEHVLTIRQAGAHLISIINDILDFSKIESGKLEINQGEYLFSSLISDTVNIIRVRMAEKPISFAVNVEPNLPNSLVGDDIRIRQILLNILNNAVKYTEEGFITLSIEGEKLDESTLRLRMVVRDSGVGIKEEDIANLFVQFVQFDTSKHKGVEGTGLGLAITRSLCRAMGGEIEVTSVYGEGSVFTVTLIQEYIGQDCIAVVDAPETKKVLIYEPRKVIADSIAHSMVALHVPHVLVTNKDTLCSHIFEHKFEFIFISIFLYTSHQKYFEQAHCMKSVVVITEYGKTIANKDIKTISMPLYVIPIAHVLNGMSESYYVDTSNTNSYFTAPQARVLVVDDISTNLKVAEGLMASYGMTIDLCESGADAVEMIRTVGYDIVFMDHMMPGMDGIEATRTIRELPNGKGVPIIALTANAISGMREVFLSNGFNDFLAKPIETSKLNVLLERWIPKEKQENAPYCPPKPNQMRPLLSLKGSTWIRG